ncbi:MAG: MBL fold metallo-hydrolase [Deferrisomatales bacterium]|nr:MBL fold metallo-hydrolase [Deferrisomatales bacterium]
MVGPEDRLGPGLHTLGPGVWITSGRSVVLEGADHLALVDPGDEPFGNPAAPTGPLAELRRLERETGKVLSWILVTHSHPDHVANLSVLRAAAPDARVVAHRGGPLEADLSVGRRVWLELGGGVEAIPTPGHSAAGDDLSFWRPEGALLLPGDLVQPKGETWGAAFYPSPWPYFTEPAPYLRSLEGLSRLPFSVLATGHREVRFEAQARAWLELTARAIRRVGEEVARWRGADDLAAAGPAIFRLLAEERGIPASEVARRLAVDGQGTSPFQRFDLPGVTGYWARRCRRARGDAEDGLPGP